MTHTRIILLAVVALALAGAAAAHGRSAADVTLSGHAWRCQGPVYMGTVTVTIGPTDRPNDGVFLSDGCTGHIDSIVVDQWQADGIKVGVGAHDLTVGSITVHCYAHDAGTHQDGVQVMGGRDVTFAGGYVGCYSANDSQAMIHTGAANRETPTRVVFDGVTFDPAGAQDPTGQPLYSYGPGGAYGMSNGASLDSGYANSTLLTDSNHHPCFTGNDAVNAVWTNDAFPAGDACP